MNGLTVEVDQGLCMGSGSCVEAVPELFALDDDGLAVVTTPDGRATGPVAVEDALSADVRAAATACPACAIVVTDAEGAAGHG